MKIVKNATWLCTIVKQIKDAIISMPGNGKYDPCISTV